jgi:hypothetical protein
MGGLFVVPVTRSVNEGDPSLSHSKWAGGVECIKGQSGDYIVHYHLNATT